MEEERKLKDLIEKHRVSLRLLSEETDIHLCTIHKISMNKADNLKLSTIETINKALNNLNINKDIPITPSDWLSPKLCFDWIK